MKILLRALSLKKAKINKKLKKNKMRLKILKAIFFKKKI